VFLRRSHIKNNDVVSVLSGKDKGKTGRVLAVHARKRRAVVEGVQMIKQHVRPNQMGQGGVIEKEGTIHLSNLKLVCPKCNTPTRTKRQVFEREVGTRTKKYRLRVCKKCGAVAEQD
jgi:large subunit ribosomal protein L24